MTGFGREIRHEFALAPEMAFLNNGSFGATPRRVLAAQDALRAELEAQPVRFLVDELPARLERAVGRLAPLLGADASELAFVDNATTGVAAVLSSFPLRPGDVIALTDHGYAAVKYMAMHAASRAGARVVEIPVPFPLSSPDEVVDAVERGWPGRTVLAVFDAITSPTGVVFPVDRLVAIARSRGASVLVDGAHTPGHVPVDLPAIGADWWVGNLHKWLYAPKSAALLYAREDRQEALHPPVISHGYGKGLQAEFHWLGTRDPTPWLAAVAGLAFAEELGIERIQGWNHGLRAQAVELLTKTWGTRATAPPAMLGGMATLELPFRLEGTLEAAQAVHRALWERHRIEIPVFPWGGRGWTRISAQVFNEIGDYERLAAAIGETGVR
jgi:isopenicillin-N epimerase